VALEGRWREGGGKVGAGGEKTERGLRRSLGIGEEGRKTEYGKGREEGDNIP
jgi:hypothetical protein